MKSTVMWKTILVTCILSTITADEYCQTTTNKKICTVSITSTRTDDLSVNLEDEHRYFYCVSCDIFNFPSFFTRGFSYLQRIDFSKSHMKILELKTQNPADALKIFNVSHNDISNTLKSNSLFISAKNLQWIDLSYNKIPEISADVFDRFESLEQIDLSFNLIETLDELTFSKLHALETLKLNNNLLQSIRLHFNRASSLTGLDFSFNAIESIDAEVFSNMPKLMNLQLNNNKLRSIDANIFAHKSNLCTLDISHNYCKDFDVKLLYRQINLAELYVNDIGLTSIEKMNISVEYFPSLKRIGISQNHWSCGDLSILLKQLISIGITVQVEQPAKNQHVNSVECIAEDYMEIMSKIDKSIDEVRTKFNGTIIKLEERMNNISISNDEERNKISGSRNELDEMMKNISETNGDERKKIQGSRNELAERMKNISISNDAERKKMNESRQEFEEKIKVILESNDKERNNMEVSRKELDDHVKEAKKLQQHTVYYMAVSFCLIGMVIVLLPLAIVLLYRLPRRKSDMNVRMSTLLDM